MYSILSHVNYDIIHSIQYVITSFEWFPKNLDKYLQFGNVKMSMNLMWLTLTHKTK